MIVFLLIVLAMLIILLISLIKNPPPEQPKKPMRYSKRQIQRYIDSRHNVSPLDFTSEGRKRKNRY